MSRKKHHRHNHLTLGKSGLILLISLIIFSVVFLYMCRQLWVRMVENVHLQAMSMVEQLSSELDADFSEIQQNAEILGQLAELDTLSDADLQTMLGDILSRLHGKYPMVFSGSIAFEPYQRSLTSRHTMWYRYFERGMLVPGTNIGENYDYFKKAWYVLPKELGRPNWSEPYFNRDMGGALMTSCSVPFFRYNLDGTRAFNGVISIDLKLDDLCARLKNTKINQQGYAILLSRFGRYMTHPKNNLVMNETIFSTGDEYRELGRDMIAGGKGAVNLPHTWVYGDSAFVVYAPAHIPGWSVAIVYPESQLFVSMRQIALRVAVIALAAIILQLLIAGVVAGNFNWILHRLFR